MSKARQQANLSSDGNLFADISNDRVGVGSVAPSHKLTVAGSSKLDDVTIGTGGETTAIGVRFNSQYAQIKLPDGQTGGNKKGNLSFGDGDDFRIVFDAHHTYLTAYSGDVYFGFSGTTPLKLKSSAGSAELYYGSTKRIETLNTGAKITGNLEVTGVVTYDDVTSVDSVGIVTAREGIFVPDNKVIHLGNAYGTGDLQIYHDTSDSYVKDVGTGDLVLQTQGGHVRIKYGSDTMALFQPSNKAELYYANSAKLATSSTGVTVTGRVDPAADSTHDLGTTSVRWRNIYGDTLYGDGSNLTGITQGVPSDAQYNTAAGTNAGDSFNGTNALRNTLFGYDAGTDITNADDATAFGYNALGNLTTGARNTAFGVNAGQHLTYSDNNTLLGYNAGSTGGTGNLTGGVNCIIIGYEARATAAGTSNEVTIGNDQITKFRIPGINFELADNGGTATNGHVLTMASGGATWAAGGVTSDAQNNTLAGSNAGDSFSGTNASNNTLIGYNAGTAITSGDENTAIGSGALAQNQTGGENIAIGKDAFQKFTASFGIAIGLGAAANSQTGMPGVIIGRNACYTASGGNLTSSVVIGMQAASGASSVTDCVVIGDYAKSSGNMGTNNIIIGKSAAPSSTSVAHEITLGDTRITKFRIPGINFSLKDNGGTPSSGQVLTADGSGDGYWAAASSTTINSNTNNYLITGTGTAGTLQGESNLTYDGAQLSITGTGTPPVYIGGANPGIKFEDTNASGTPLSYIYASDGQLSIRADDGNETASSLIGFNVDGSERARIDSSGRFLLGRTSTYASSSEKLSVNGMTSIQYASTSAAGLYIFNTDNTGSGAVQPFIFMHDGGGIRGGLGLQYSTSNLIINGQSDIQFRTGASGISGTERARITSAGKVGINQNDPYYTLDVQIADNTTALSGGSGGDWGGNGIRLENTSTTNGSMSLIHFRTEAADWHVGSKRTASSTSDIVFLNEGTSEKLRITSTSQVKITGRGSKASGTPLYLAVTGNSSITYGGGNDDTACLRIEDCGGNNSYYHGLELRTKRSGDIRLYAHDKGDNLADFVLAVDDGTNPAEKLRITSDGYAAIAGAGDLRLTLGSQGTAGTNTANWLRAQNTNLMYNAASGSHIWEIGGSEKVRINSGGLFGIGVSSPTERLHVYGNAIITGMIMVGDGTTSNCAIANEGDSHTGMYFPANDNVSFSTGGTQRFLIDSSGIVKIGNSVSNYYSNDLILKCSANAGGITIASNGTSDSNFINFADSTSSPGYLAGGIKYVHSNDTMMLRTNNTERVEISGDSNTAVLKLYNQANTDASATCEIQANHDIRDSSKIVFGRENADDWSASHNSQYSFLSFYTRAGSGGLTEKVRINSGGNLLPGADNSYNLGASGTRWANIYTTDLQLSNEGASNEVDGTWGNYTIQEGEDDLFLINRRNGKRYKFNLTEMP